MSTIIIHGHKDLITKAKEKVQSHFTEIVDIVLPRPINSVKVVRIKRQLANGSYDIDERLDAVLDEILKDVVA
jgi:anti-sigma28 factor (negative regulator of flagellin synthesis)